MNRVNIINFLEEESAKKMTKPIKLGNTLFGFQCIFCAARSPLGEIQFDHNDNCPFAILKKEQALLDALGELDLEKVAYFLENHQSISAYTTTWAKRLRKINNLYQAILEE